MTISKEFIGVNIDHCVQFAKQNLSPRRFEHSFGVMQVMSELALIYGLDKTDAMIAGILHDIAKEFTPDELITLAKENNIALRTKYDKHPLFLHGPISACYVSQELGITDPMILDVISQHSYFGDRVALSPAFCWCLRFADMLEPSRDWEDLKSRLKPLVYSGKIGKGAYLLVQWMIPFHKSISLPVHPNIHRVDRELSALKDAKNLDEISNLPI